MVQLFEVKALQEGNVHKGFCCSERLKSNRCDPRYASYTQWRSEVEE